MLYLVYMFTLLTFSSNNKFSPWRRKACSFVKAWVNQNIPEVLLTLYKILYCLLYIIIIFIIQTKEREDTYSMRIFL